MLARPAPGKTTYVQQRAAPDALVVDYDALADAVGAEYGDDRLRPLVQRARDAILEELAADPHRFGAAWIIRGAPTAAERERYRQRFGASVVVVATPPEECKRRAAEAGRPPIWPELIDQWWASYEPDPRDLVVTESAPQGGRTMSVHKRYRAALLKADGADLAGAGTFEALVSVFGNVDLAGDRIIKGAFAKSLERWSRSGDPIPILWSHQWDNPQAHLGAVLEIKERDDGLWIRGQLDHEDRDTYAPLIWRKMQRRLVKEFSFAYDVLDERPADDGANELVEVDLLELGPCLKGVNPDTQLLAVKAALAPHGGGTSDGPWDGPANEANLSTDAGADTYRQAFAWVDPDADPGTKSAYRFIHHEVSAEGRVGAANVTACVTGIGILNGGRGGTNIPDADRRGVYNHLARHLRDADREPPELRGAANADAEGFAREVRALLGLDPPAGKAGRVLSTKNEQSIRQAVDLLSGVLERLDEQPRNPTDEPAKGRAKPAAKPRSGEEPDGEEPDALRSPFSLSVLAQADAL